MSKLHTILHLAPVPRRLSQLALILLLALAWMLYLPVVQVCAVPSSTPPASTRIPGCSGNRQTLATLIARQEKSTRLCGRLVYLTDERTGVHYLGLLPCGQALPLIFKQAPRDLVQFYQFRNPRIESGPEIFSSEYGCISGYITTFKNYVGLEDCDQCGRWNPPPTWTFPPKYSPTPVTPSPTPTVTNTPLPTFTSPPPLPTRRISELLFGTPTPTASTSSLPAPSNTPIPLPTVVTTERPFPGNLCGSALLFPLALPLLFVIVASRKTLLKN